MRRSVWIGVLLVALAAAGRGAGMEPSCCEPPQDCFLKNLGPVGGWHPYGGGLLHWWPRHSFPCGGAPDDYFRKPLPRVCWPPYPPYYTWGPPEVSSPSGGCRVGSGDSR
jgi:hypothetical protein